MTGLAGAMAIGLWFSGHALAQTGNSTAPPESAQAESVRSATVLTIHGKIVEVDQEKKSVTLEANGRRVALRVDNPINLQAAKVGEPVVIRYFEVVSVRKKRPDEQVPAVSLKEGLTTAQPGGTPGAVAERHATVLVTVADVDAPNGTITIKGPDGSTEKTRVRDPKILSRIKAGDELVVTVSMATAISLEKESKD
jgi:Cu/Ag efflux protein CusF